MALMCAKALGYYPGAVNLRNFRNRPLQPYPFHEKYHGATKRRDEPDRQTGIKLQFSALRKDSCISKTYSSHVDFLPSLSRQDSVIASGRS